MDITRHPAPSATMRHQGSYFCFWIALLACGLRPAFAENWPAWRGPRGDGSSESHDLPLHWDGASGDNIRWTSRLPGDGLSSPIVWENRVFLTTCQPETRQRLLLCFDRERGKLLWSRAVLTARLESKHSLNSFATSTPATDGAQVFVTFLEVGDEQVPAPNVGTPRLINPGQMVVAAYDYAGNQQWLVRAGSFLSAHGFASNPVLHGDMVLVNGDHDGDSYLVALDKHTGSILWKTPRHHKMRSYATPIVRNIDDRVQLLLCGSRRVAGFDASNGALIWHVEAPTDQFVASMVYDGEFCFAVGGFPTHHVLAVRPTGRGDVGKSHVAWHTKQVRCYVPSPVIVDRFLIVADDRGTANCFDTTSGQRLWQTRLGKHYSASLLTNNGLVYFTADDGITKILRPAKTPDVVASNELGEHTYASLAASQDELFIRGARQLYCIAAD